MEAKLSIEKMTCQCGDCLYLMAECMRTKREATLVEAMALQAIHTGNVITYRREDGSVVVAYPLVATPGNAWDQDSEAGYADQWFEDRSGDPALSDLLELDLGSVN